MDPITLGSLGIVFMFILIALHVPIGIAMAVAGFFGLWAMIGIEGATNIFATTPTDLLVHQSLAAIPMFLLMGSFASAAGLSGDLYRLFHGFVGHYRGGLAMATVAGCGGFGAVCGSSIATASTFMRVALPENARPEVQAVTRHRLHRRGRHPRHPHPAVQPDAASTAS